MRVAGKYSLNIRRPVEEVFAFMATGFFENRPKWLPQAVESEQTSVGEMQVGTTGRQLYMSKEAGLVETNYIVREYEPPTRFATDSTVTYGTPGNGQGGPVTYSAHGESILESVGNETRLHLRYRYELPSYPSWRLTKPIWKSRWDDECRKSALALKNYLEAEAGLPRARTPFRFRKSWVVFLGYLAVIVALWWAYSSRLTLGLTADLADWIRLVLSTMTVLGIVMLMILVSLANRSRSV